MPRVGVATVSGIAAEAGAWMADEGGNAVDAAMAAAVVAAVTHPGMCSLGCGGFVSVWPPDGPPVTVDGGLEMPGRGRPPERFGGGGIPVRLTYAGGVDTVVGPGSVATPGGVAASALALERFGRLPWATVLQPAVERAREGFPLPASSHEYLLHAHDRIFGWHEESRSVLHDEEGRLKPPGATLRIPGLADTLSTLAMEGPEAFYRGRIARRIVAAVEAGGGLLGMEDLSAYRPLVRPALRVDLDAWRLATNPPPAIGGAALAAMLLLMGDRPRGAWNDADVRRLVAAQEAVLGYRRRHLDGGVDREAGAERLLAVARTGRLPLDDGPGAVGAPDAPEGGSALPGLSSPSTLHCSAVDSDGLACAVTLSDGYGSGLMPPGTGFWLNNCLGETELNGRGYHAWDPGSRLPSNMAPTVGRSTDGSVLAIGSPGADRITTAILQTLLAFVRLGLPLDEAVDHPRLHVESTEEGSRIAHEPGLAVEEMGMPSRRHERRAMYFGGVEAVEFAPGRGFELAADRRRTGGTALGGRNGSPSSSSA